MATSVQETADLLRAVLTDLAPLVGTIPPEQLHDATPCTEWDVEQLRNHTVGWLTLFAAGFADANGQAPGADVDGYTVSDDPAGEVRSAADDHGSCAAEWCHEAPAAARRQWDAR